MNNPQLYTSVNELQKRDAQDAIENVKSDLPWRKNENILDVGCGPGDLTVNLLRSYLPEDAHIVGCDISESMVKYADSKYGNDRISFKQLDIQNPNIWVNWDEESFDKIFSFYCLNWVKDQRQAAQNMNSLLKPNGHLVTMFTIAHPFIVYFNYLSKQPKFKSVARVWNTWDVFDSDKDPKQEYINILKQNQFHLVSSNSYVKIFNHPSKNHFIDYFQSINPFVKKVPQDQAKQFVEDCTNEMLSQGLLIEYDNGEIVHEYTLLLTHALKVYK